jgi:predicted MFS family arabinose efflux permease
MPLLAILAAGCFVSSMSMRIIDPVVPEIARDLHVDAGSVAMLASYFAFPYALAQPVLGVFGDAFGKARVIKTALAILALCLAASAAATSLTMLSIARLVGGAAAGGIIPLAFAIVGDRFQMKDRQLALSRVLTAIIAGQLTGSIGSGFLASFMGWRVASYVATALTLLALAVTVPQLRPNTKVRTNDFRPSEFLEGYKAVFANPHTIVCYSAVFVESIVIFGLFPYVTVLLEQRGAGSLKEAGFVLAGFGLGGFLYTGLVRVMIGRLGIYRLIVAGGAVSGFGLALIALKVPWPVESAIFMIVGVGFYMIHNSLQTLATELAPLHRATGVAGHSFSVFLGQAFGPIVYAAGLASVGASLTLVTAGAVMAALGLATAAALRARAPEPLPKIVDAPPP